MKTQVIKSRRRKKTAGARLVRGILRVRVPTSLSEEKVESLVKKFKKSFQKKKDLGGRDWLTRRAEKLNQKYFGGKLRFEINWSGRQKKVFGSCTSRQKKIRVSSRLAKAPKWVLDYVLVHELAHLLEPNHSQSFWKLVRQYKRAERARGFLIGMGFEEEG